jgi:Ca-activated chloride channel family protein
MGDLFGLLTRTGSNPVPLSGVRVTGDLLGRGARVNVAQRFRNSEAQAIEAVYRFPLPETAAVCGFSAIVGGRRITGSVEEREKAFETYDDALARGDGAFLLDQERPNIFTLSVGSLPPGAEAVVEIEYVALLDQRGKEIRFSLPTTISPRYLPADTPDEGGIPARDRIHPVYAASVPYGLSVEIAVRDPAGVESVESPSHPISVSMGNGRTTDEAATIVRFASDAVAMDRDFVLTITHRGKEQGRAWRFSDGKSSWAQLDLAPDEAESAPGYHGRREVIFVLDCSGSMQGDSMDQAKRALEVCLKAMEAGCSFNIVRFGSKFESLFPQPREYGERSLGEALGWLAAVNADLGGTEVLAPLTDVYKAPVTQGTARSVVLLTDGQVGNEADVMSLVRGNVATTRFFAVGIGAGPNDHLVRSLARTGGGTAAFIFPGERIEPRVLGIFRQAIGARVSNLRIDWSGRGNMGGKVEQSPASPTLLLGEPMSAFARFGGVSAATPATVTVSAEADGKPLRWELPVADAGSGRIPLPTLWARARIRDLEESPEAGGKGSRQHRPKSEAWKQEVVSLAREFGLSSSLTSWVAVEEREEKDMQTGELVLRKVPTLVTVGWHGVGSVQGARFGGVAMMQSILPLGRPTMMRDADVSQIAYEMPSPYAQSTMPDTMAMLRKKTPGAPVSAKPAAGSESTDTDLLMALLALQRVGGGFDLHDAMLGLLGITPAEITKAAAGLPCEKKAALRVLHTAIVLAVLEARFSNSREVWFAAVRKSRIWLKQATDGWGPVAHGKTVARWAEDLTARADSSPKA